MLIGTNLTYTKAYNYRIVFETIRLFGPISRAAVARRSNLTAQTVSNIVKRLLDTELIREGDKQQEGRGAPSMTLKVNAAGAYSIGLDFNRDHLTGVLVDLTGNVKHRIYYELTSPTPDESIKLMTSTIQQLKTDQNLDEEKLRGIGISFPGPMNISKNNNVSNTVNPKEFPNWENIPVVALLSEHTNVPVYLENNASAAAVGERWYGAGRQVSSFMYVFFGAGLGSGIFMNGRLCDGHTGNAGEIGYLPLSDKKSLLSTSSTPYVGEHFHLTRLYEWLNKSGADVSQPGDLLDLYQGKNPEFMEWTDQAKEILVPVFLSIEYLIDPEVIFLGGRLPMEIIEDFTTDLTERLKNERINEKSTYPILKCATAGSDAAALGAATLPMFDLFAPQAQVLIKRNGKVGN